MVSGNKEPATEIDRESPGKRRILCRKRERNLVGADEIPTSRVGGIQLGKVAKDLTVLQAPVEAHCR
jgi:hypothetical protein